MEYVVQDLPVSTDNNGFRLFANTQYKYDLLTKKVLGVAYNYYESDSYEQSYNYDANNRLVKVNSSRYNELKDRESEYKYYNHGPLKRVELGEDKLQGIDYTYTINGWLKAINHTTLSSTVLDPGRDGNSNSKYGEDAFSSILNYFKGDFVNSYSDFNNNSLFPTGLPFAENFDGNIAIWQSNSMMYNGSTYTYDNFHQGFKYDAINRLKHSNRYTTTPNSTLPNYKTTYSYDANGNISNLGRHDATGAQFDNLSYQYNSGATNNKLTQITESPSPSAYVGDLENQPDPNNYSYDASGNLIGDASEGLSNVKWTPDGKIKSMTKTALAGTPPLPVTNNIAYTYDAMGQRVMKMVTTMGQTPNTKQTIYARDANGQVMAIYEREFNPSENNNPHGKLKFKLKLEWYVHGCIGEIELIEGVNFIIDTVTNSIIITADIQGAVSAPCNHAFVLQQGTSILLDPPFNEKEEQWGWGGYRQYNQSNSKSYKTPKAITLQVNGNPVSMQIKEINVGMSYSNPEFLPKLAEWHIYGNEQQGRFLTKYPEELTPTYYGTEVTDDIKDNKFKRQLGKKSYELKDHLGNVRVTHSDIKMPTGTPAQPFRVDLLSKSEYYPYGMKINDLSYSVNGTGTRYGYNGTHERDKELNADGNYLDFGNFGYDTRVAMRRNQEPLRMKFPGLSGYAVFGNNPIYFQDPDGHDLNSALIEGSIALTLDLGLNVISDVVFGNKEINSSLRKHIGGAVYEGVKTTLIAVLLPPGSTSYKKIEKFATSKIGKFTSKFIANYLERTALNLSKGEYKDKNGNYTIKNTVIEIGEDLIIAMLETLIDEGMNDAAFDHFQKLANKSERLTKAYEKLLNSKGNSLKSLQNKVEKATKELGKEVGGAIVKEGKKSTLKKSTEMKVEEISDKVKKYYNEDPLPEEFEIEVNTDEGD